MIKPKEAIVFSPFLRMNKPIHLIIMTNFNFNKQNIRNSGSIKPHTSENKRSMHVYRISVKVVEYMSLS
jgi:hypothetical protein